MKFSSSLLVALIGGPCCACFLEPPMRDHEPTAVVARVAMAS